MLFLSMQNKEYSLLTIFTPLVIHLALIAFILSTQIDEYGVRVRSVFLRIRLYSVFKFSYIFPAHVFYSESGILQKFKTIFLIRVDSDAFFHAEFVYVIGFKI